MKLLWYDRLYLHSKLTDDYPSYPVIRNQPQTDSICSRSKVPNLNLELIIYDTILYTSTCISGNCSWVRGGSSLQLAQIILHWTVYCFIRRLKFISSWKVFLEGLTFVIGLSWLNVIFERFQLSSFELVEIERASLLTYDGLCVGLTIITERSRIGLNNHVKPCAYLNKKSTLDHFKTFLYKWSKISAKLLFESVWKSPTGSVG